MKFDISYILTSNKNTIWYTEDRGLSFDGLPIEASSEEEALSKLKLKIVELFCANCLEVQEDRDEVLVYEPSSHALIERYHSFKASKLYTLTNTHGEQYFSRIPGTLGGHRKLRIYGRLDCPSALLHISKGNYIKHRVFFLNEEIAKAAGYRPCAKCMPVAYQKWKEIQKSQEVENLCAEKRCSKSFITSE